MVSYVSYSDDLEQVAEDEKVTIAKIIEVMAKSQAEIAEKYDKTVRISHAKAHTYATGELIVQPDLPPELAQGLFAQPGRHDVIVRISQAPGEVLDDRDVSSPRGMAVKVFGVEGPKLPGHSGSSTQDFVFDTGKKFINSDLKAFLANFSFTATVAPKLPEAVKGAVSKSAEVVNAALDAAGVGSPKLDFYGHPSYHPLAEAYFSQIALRYGDHVAKIAFIPANPALQRLYHERVDLDDADALRHATRDFFANNAAEYDVKVQLATDPARMPVEDPMVEWSEEESPYRTVGRIVLPRQELGDANRHQAFDDDLSFSPAHALEAHRPLGAIGRARIKVYPAIAAKRRTANGRPVGEPKTLADAERASALIRRPPRLPAPAQETNGHVTQQLATGLGWFSLALGLTELVAAKPLARSLGIESTALVRAFGLREITAGAGLLLQARKGPWVWARIAGDALDLAVLAGALRSRNPRRGNAAIAVAVVAPVVALDVVCGARLGWSK